MPEDQCGAAPSQPETSAAGEASAARLPAISLLLVDDDEPFRNLLTRRFARRGHEVAQTGSPQEALDWASRRRFDVAILDVSMPEMDGVTLLEKLRQVSPETQAIMLTGQATLETAVRAMKLGAFDYLTKPCDLADLELHVQRACEKELLARENRNLKAMVARSQGPQAKFIGHSPALQEMLRLIERVAPTSSPALILGESGVGKELVARCIHQLSPRRDQPLVVINCAALQEPLLESELFGHEKGAFTTAISTKPGLFEMAHGGTLFIDEVGELAAPLQAKLLRAIEDGVVRRLGSVKDIKTDVRIVAATNRDLAAEVAARRFRDDLYFRLNVIAIQAPPLRARAEDIPDLAAHFLRQPGPGPTEIDEAALAALLRHSWPGNIRELANVITRAKILAEGPRVRLTDLPEALVRGAASASARPHPSAAPPPGAPCAPQAEPNGGGGRKLAEHECDLLQSTLREKRGNKAQAAKTLGISRRKLYRLLEKHGLDGGS